MVDPGGIIPTSRSIVPTIYWGVKIKNKLGSWPLVNWCVPCYSVEII